jgi:hypothetical protein
VGGVLTSLLGHMGWGYGRILEGVGENSLVIPNLRWEMAEGSNSSIICHVGI